MSAPPHEETYHFSPKLVALTGLPAAQSETIRQIASEVVTHHLSYGRRGLAICSASQGAGVTFMAANLAVVLAQSGFATLLVEANLEQMDLQELIRPMHQRPGLADFLADPDLDFADAVHDEVLPNLSIVYGGAVAGDAHELLGGSRFEQFLDRGLRNYACVLVDTPPANLSADARRVATVVGYALIVARRNSTFADDLAVLRTELLQDAVTVLGSILNGS